MKNIVFIPLLLFISCSGPSKPTFIGIENITPVEKDNFTYSLSADLHMENENSVGAKLLKTDLDVFANDVEVGKIRQLLNTDIKANSRFTIPIAFTFNVQDILKNQATSIEGLLSSAFTKKINLKYVGTVKLEIAGISFNVPVEHEQEVDL